MTPDPMLAPFWEGLGALWEHSGTIWGGLGRIAKKIEGFWIDGGKNLGESCRIWEELRQSL